MQLSITILNDEFPIRNTPLVISGDIVATIACEYDGDLFAWELESLITLTGKGTLESPYIRTPIPDKGETTFLWAIVQDWLEGEQDRIWEKYQEAEYNERH
ncbi:MAG: hypothetical protein GY928_30780 [Colwellia sp.]|nr:hypothetical protein [Colwellia sp.]